MESKKQNADFRQSLHGLPYEMTAPMEPPLVVTSASTPQLQYSPHRSSPNSPVVLVAKPKVVTETRRDTNAAYSSSSVGDYATDVKASDGDDDAAPGGRGSVSPNVPRIRVDKASTKNTPKSEGKANKSSTSRVGEAEDEEHDEVFHGIILDIPTGGLSDEIPTGNMEFSKRGSMFLDGHKVNAMLRTKKSNGGSSEALNTARTTTMTTTASAAAIPTAMAPRLLGGTSSSGRRVTSNPSLRARVAAKVLSTDEEMLSQRVRSFYEVGSATTDTASDAGSSVGAPSLGERIGLRWQDALAAHDANNNGGGSGVGNPPSRATSKSDMRSETSAARCRDSAIQREDMELAGGLEDWQDVDYADVDRYGFIISRRSTTNLPAGGANGVKRSPTTTTDPYTLQRVSTSLQLASETPRRKHTIRRSPSSAHGPAGSPGGNNTAANSSRPTSLNARKTRPMSSMSAYRGSLNGNSSRLRRASNRLPHNKDRRLLDEAGDMLTAPPELSSIGEDGGDHTAPVRSAVARRKEMEREDKWRKMARVTSSGPDGGGMVFDFDTSSPKLIERTWKGIPDRWRATAWHAFLSASAAKKRKQQAGGGVMTDAELVRAFDAYVAESSPDDVQIDIDVPRTISSHIMFRRRYRGGQRLLFRVLHAMSLHFPDTGYVQGMAALAATLLAYYAEERAFVMLVRLWELRGLDALYKSGFGGLMQALDDFEKKWLAKGELAGKLGNLGIGPTAYGTRWYLTLFNYSIPFSAQLRVWDVFMLLGDDSSNRSRTVSSSSGGGGQFGTTLDVLHAASAALIDGMRDILLESDFENGMKVLTSWVPIRDDDLFMRVAKAEWKMQHSSNTNQRNARNRKVATAA